MKIFKIVAVLLVILFLFLELFIFNSSKPSEDNRPLVSVSTFALYDITKHIAEESVEVLNIIPFGTDPHSFELTPKIMAKIEKSSVTFYSGAGLEPWIDKIHSKAPRVDMSQYVNLQELDADAHSSHAHHHEANENAHESTLDPHYWLDFKNMAAVTKKITSELEKLSPKNKELYRANRDKYIKMLIQLDAEYTKQLRSCEIRNVIINHNSLSYLANNYSFEAESLSGLSPEAQPSPSDIEHILKEIKKDKVETIFYENFINAKVMHSISKDSNVGAEVFSPLGNITADQADANATYESLMLENLEKLTKAMKCH